MGPTRARLSTPKALELCIVSAAAPLKSAIPLYTKEMVRGFLESGLNINIKLIVNRSAVPFAMPGVVVKPVWRRGATYPFQIFKEVTRTPRDVVHIQHEVFLYGGVMGAALFPLILLMCRLGAIPTIVTLHGVPSPKMLNAEFREGYFLPSSAKLMVIPFVGLVKMIGALSNRIIVHTNFMSRVLQADFGVPRGKIAVIPHGSPIVDALKSEDITRREDRPLRLLFFGWITPGKGLESLLDAFLSIHRSDVELIVAGGTHERDTSYVEDITELVARDTRVRMLGFLSEENLRKIFTSADVVVLPYRIQVGGGSAALAMAFGYGKPVIATNLGFFREIIKDGFNGLLVAADDIGSLREALSSVIGSPRLLETLARNASKSGETLRWDAIARRIYAECYEPLISRSNGIRKQ